MNAFVLLLLKLAVAHLASQAVDEQHRALVRGLISGLTSLVNSKLRDRNSQNQVGGVQADEQPWSAGVASVALAYSPTVLQQLGQEELAAALEEGLVEALKSGDGRVLNLVPTPEALLLERDRAIISLVQLFRAALALRGIYSPPAAPLVQAAEDLLDRMASDSGALFAGVARLLRGGASSVTSLDSTTEFIDRIVARPHPIGEGPPIVTVRDGQLFLRTGPRGKPRCWEALVLAAESSIESFEARVGGVSKAEMYLDPIALDLSDRANRARADLMVNHVARWIATASHVPLVLLGGPGTGKSTCCRWLVRNALNLWRESNGAPEEPFPVYVPLRTIRPDLGAIHAASLSQRSDILRETALLRVTDAPRVDSSLPREQRLMLLLDGYDELMLQSAEHCQTFFDAVTRLASRDDTLVLLTGRALALAPFFPSIDATTPRGSKWRRVELVPFQLGEGNSCQQYVDRWCIASERAGHPVRQRDEVIAIAQGRSVFGDVVETPALLDLICSLVERGGKVGSGAATSSVDAIGWMTEHAIRLRGNPSDEVRGPVAEEEYLYRRRLYGQWAWQAVLKGGTSFQFSGIGAVPGMAVPDRLVEFFFEDSTDGALWSGEAAFTHRMIAEYLAATYIVESVTAERCAHFRTNLMRLSALIARERLSMDANFKRYIADIVSASDLIEPVRHLIAREAEGLIGDLYCNPQRVPWPEEETLTPSLVGVAAEMCLVLYIGARQGDVGLETVRRVLELRRYSDRGETPLGISYPIRCLGRGSLSGVIAAQISFIGASINAVSFAHADLHSTVFAGCELNECSFAGADLSGCSFRGCRLVRCDFTDATLAGVDLAEADLVLTPLTATQLESVARLERCVLTPAPGISAAVEVGDPYLGPFYVDDDGNAVEYVDNAWQRVRAASVGDRSLVPTRLPERVAAGILWRDEEQRPAANGGSDTDVYYVTKAWTRSDGFVVLSEDYLRTVKREPRR